MRLPKINPVKMIAMGVPAIGVPLAGLAIGKKLVGKSSGGGNGLNSQNKSL